MREVNIKKIPVFGDYLHKHKHKYNIKMFYACRESIVDAVICSLSEFEKILIKKYGKEVGKIITIATCVVIDEANSAVVVLDREKYLVLATPDIDPEEVYDFDF
jgi:hypothetical protein